MSRFTSSVILLALLALVASCAATFGESRWSSRRITKERIAEWHDKLYNTINILGAPGGGASGLRAWAMMTIAMFDAANLATDSEYRSYLDLSGLPATINADHAEPLAAAAKAAQVVLNGLIPASTTAAVRTQLEFSHLSQLMIHLGALPTGSRTNNGIALGEFVGQRMLANRSTDGHPPNNCNNWPNPANATCRNSVPNSSLWNKYQYALSYFPGQPNSPGYPQVLPFAIPSYADSAFYVPPPPAPGTAAHLSDWLETFAYGTTNASRSLRTQTTDDIARFHDGNFASQVGWALDYISSADIDLDGVDLLRALAFGAISSHDSHATHWFYKYTHYHGRPITAYRQVPADFPQLYAARDPAFTPTLTTSQTPEHPSGHSARSGGAAFSFIRSFGDSGSFRTVSYSSPVQGARSYSSISQFYQEVQNSRVYGGVHWRSALNAGEDLSRRVTEYVHRNVMKRQRLW